MLSSRKLSLWLAAVTLTIVLAGSPALAQASGGRLHHRRHDLCGFERAAERQCDCKCERQRAGPDRRSPVDPDARLGCGPGSRGIRRCGPGLHSAARRFLGASPLLEEGKNRCARK